MRFRDLADFAMAYGWQTGFGMYALFRSTFLVHAATDDGVVHLAQFDVKTPIDMTLFFDCRALLVDGEPALPHLRGNDDDVSCMACITKTVS